MPGGTVPPDPWKVAKTTIALFDVLDWAVGQGLIFVPPEQRAALEACREDIERWRAALEAEPR
jgi:hypothetical protein